MNRLFTFILYILFFFSCTSGTDFSDGAPGPYFDLEHWMNQSFIHQDTIRSVTKMVSVGGEREEKDLSDYAIQKDLKSWLKLNWNDTRLYGTYKVDTIRNSPDNRTVQYQSLSNSNTVSQAFLSIENDTIQTVQIISDHKSAFSSSRKEYIMELHRGYTVRYCDTLFWSDGQCTLVDVGF